MIKSGSNKKLMTWVGSVTVAEGIRRVWLTGVILATQQHGLRPEGPAPEVDSQRIIYRYEETTSGPSKGER